MHPKDRGVTRGRFLRGAGSLAAVAGAGGLLAACENTTEPVGNAAGGATSPLVVPKPLGPGGLPLPRTDNSVTWAIPDDNQPIADGTGARGRGAARLQLRRLPRPGHAQEVRDELNGKRRGRDLQLGRRGDREARVRRGDVRRHPRPLRRPHRQPDRAAAPAAAQPRVPAEPRRTSGPSCRTRSTTGAAATPCPTSCGATASAGATTRSTRTSPALDVPWDIFWQSAAYKGKVGMLDD